MNRLAVAWALIALFSLAFAGAVIMQRSLPDCRTIARVHEIALSDPAVDYWGSRLRTLVETSYFCEP